MSLPPSTLHFDGIPLKTLDEFPEKPNFYHFFFVGWSCQLGLGSHGGLGWELRRLYWIFNLSTVWSGESSVELERLGEKWLKDLIISDNQAQ